MATHFQCQPTAPLANKYPLVQKSEKGHGAVSQYEPYNMGNKSHTQFPPPGWDTSQSSEESLPLCQPPLPSWKSSSGVIGPDPSLSVTPDKSSNVLSTKRKHFYPVPAQYHPGLTVIPDPELCITPEKSCNGKQKSNLKTGLDVNSKAKQKVRFEMNNSDSDKENASVLFEESSELDASVSKSGKTYSPDDYSGSENFEDLDFGTEINKESTTSNYSKTLKYKLSNSGKNTVYVPLKGHEADSYEHKSDNNLQYESVLPTVLTSRSDQITDNGKTIHVEQDKKLVKDKIKLKSKKETLVNKSNSDVPYLGIPKDSNPKRRVRITREVEERPIADSYKFPFKDDVESRLQFEHVFNRPEYNSTLRVRKELEHIKDCEVDVNYAVGRKLAKSETKLTEIKEKAASQVNQKDETKFSGLVSLQVPLDDIKHKVELEKAAKVKSKHSSKQQGSATCGREPDLMEFFTPSMQQEFIELSVSGVPPSNQSLSTASHRSAFDLYRHNRVWNGNSNFKSAK